MVPEFGYEDANQMPPPAGGVMFEKDILGPAPSVDGMVATLHLSECVIPPSQWPGYLV